MIHANSAIRSRIGLCVWQAACHGKQFLLPLSGEEEVNNLMDLLE
jgi:hypothetical protein